MFSLRVYDGFSLMSHELLMFAEGYPWLVSGFPMAALCLYYCHQMVLNDLPVGPLWFPFGST